jgi:excinuclease ABC subunit A
MAAADIVIRGARTHNLRSIDLVLPRNKLICLTGVSGSGKSSLAFDTLYAEGQRRYVESLSHFARQFLGQLPKPDVDAITGLSPSISISQKSAGQNPRSTVGTITEIYDYLRVLYARTGRGHCPRCQRPMTAQTRAQIIAAIGDLPSGSRLQIFAPLVRQQKGQFRDLFEDLRKQGFVRARVDGTIVELADDLGLDRQMRHNIDLVIDRMVAGPRLRTRLAEAVEVALKVGNGNLIVVTDDAETAAGRRPPRDTPAKAREKGYSADYACTHCQISFEPPTPQLFSFNSPQGMCLKCNGLGEVFTFDPQQLVTRPDRSIKQGCIELVGKWSDLSRWRRHIFRGVAATVERTRQFDPGTMLTTPWQDLAAPLQQTWLWGTGSEHITFTWRHGTASYKYGGEFEGVIPELVAKYTRTKSKPQLRQLEQFMRVLRCPDCHGSRLNPQACAVQVESTHDRFTARGGMSLPEVCQLSIAEASDFFSQLKLDRVGTLIAPDLLKEIRGRLGFLINVGLDYLALDRTAPTLSGGEAQRIRLAGQIGCGLVGVLYILDEPSIGLHPRDNGRLLETLKQLRNQGNTVVVVEHDEETMRAADHLIDFGPGAGVRGGRVVAQGQLRDVIKQKRSVTGRYLAGSEAIEVPARRRPIGRQRLKIVAAAHNNLKNIDIEIPLGALVCITGVSGSGKSSLVNDILIETLRRDLNGGKGRPGQYRRITGLKDLDKLIAIDQSPIGRTPRSNPGTYIKVLDDIRGLFAQLPESKRRGYRPGRFSFNVRGGRCEACQGNGANRVEMDFLADLWVTCPVCDGHRFNRETLAVRFKDRSIGDVLEMDVQEAVAHFENIPDIRHKLQTLHDVGLDYVKLGQPSPTLSGGEAQRIKLARELVKKSTGRTLYVLDEPTTGLHFADIRLLLDVLHRFVDAGNTVLVVEHNLEVIKTADWVIDLGPEGGDQGGEIVAVGTPEQIAAEQESYTGQALATVIGADRASRRPPQLPAVGQRRRAVTQIRVRGASQHNLKEIDVAIPRDQLTVLCGPSGSGKSSLAMDTIYAEGQRRYVESLSAYARQFVSQMQKPRVEHIEGLSPAIAIQQRNTAQTPRSTVGTVTEIYDYLRILFARLGTPYCPECDVAVGTQSADEIIDKIMAEPAGTRLEILAPRHIDAGQTYRTLWNEIRAAGYVRVRINGQTLPLDDAPEIDRRRKHAVQVVVDRVTIRADRRGRIAEAVEAALAIGGGELQVVYPHPTAAEPSWRERTHSQHLACQRCGRSFQVLSPHNFSFNSPLGWCPSCEGLGAQTGANSAALIPDPKRTLADQAVSLWPDIRQVLASAMLNALAAQTGLPLDVPFEQLSPRQRRTVLYGTGETWFDVPRGKRPKAGTQPLFRFQYKGLYPALEEAAKLSPSLRARLDHLVGTISCSQCDGSRLRDDAAAVRFRGQTIDQWCRIPLDELLRHCRQWRLSTREKRIAGELLREIRNRMTFLVDVGLDYLTLGRSAPTLSGGEAQRIRLASQVGSGLCGVLYVLDEPTIGLHPRDNQRLIAALRKLRDLGNTLLVVEHDRDVVASADRLLDFGPGAGRHGGRIVAQGTPQQLASRRSSVTGPYLSGRAAIPVPTTRRIDPDTTRSPDQGWLEIIAATHNNLQKIDVRIPLGTLTVVTGPSGSGKSSLVNDILYNQLARTLHRARTVAGAHAALRGVAQINKVIRVDQRPFGNSPASNPATYTGVFEQIRNLFAQLPEAKLRGYTPRRFSFNAAGGRCDACTGNGRICIEMHFLPDVWVECETCHGQRYQSETLAVRYQGHSIADILDMPCGEALKLFRNIPKIRRILATLCDVGLHYLTLGQAAPTLSGGEAQRVKLAAELARPDTGRTLYLLDEPTTGLHFSDLAQLLDVLHRLVDLGNTVVVIEHNLDVVKTADWVIDLGPEAGAAGGQVVVAGTPEQVGNYARGKPRAAKRRKTAAADGKPRSAVSNAQGPLRSYTGELLAVVLEAGPQRPRKVYDPATADAPTRHDIDIADVGRDAKMPWEIDGRRWHTTQRIGRDGQAAQWDGQVLDLVEQRIHQLGEFGPTDWNVRSVVEIAAPRKADGWFLHAVTGETWLLKLKFQTARNTFRRDQLIVDLALKPLSDLEDLPVYGRRQRVHCKNRRGPWQEIQIDVHTLAEVDRPQFWDFLQRAVDGFLRVTDRGHQRPEDRMPWKVVRKDDVAALRNGPNGDSPKHA